MPDYLLNTSNTLENKVLSGNCSCFVEAADINATSKGNTKRFSAENGYQECQSCRKDIT